MAWARRHPAVVNSVLTFASAIFLGLRVNYLSGSDPMTDRKHLLLVLAIVILVVQCWYIATTARPEKRIVNELLDLGTRFFIAHAKARISAAEIRAIVHLCEKTRPGRKLARQRCLVPKYWKSPVAPRDFGAIPIDSGPFRKWYVNVRAFHEQKVLCAEPDLAARPSDDEHDVSTPSQFSAKSVLSTPIWSRMTPPAIIGTLTFDSIRSLDDMNWRGPAGANEAAKDMLHALSDLIGKILANDVEGT